MKHCEFEISCFVDGELPAADEKELFAHLSECPECRRRLNDSLKMKKEISAYYSLMNYENNSAVAAEYAKTRPGFSYFGYRLGLAASAAAVIALCFLLYFARAGQSNLEEKYNRLNNEVTALKESGNSRPEGGNAGATGRAALNKKTVEPVNNRRAVKREKKNLENHEKERPTFKAPAGYIPKYASLPSVEIKKENFLVQQIVGN
jgi:hypothetical protein